MPPGSYPDPWDGVADEPSPDDFLDAEPVSLKPRRGRVLIALAILAVTALGAFLLAWMSLSSLDSSTDRPQSIRSLTTTLPTYVDE